VTDLVKVRIGDREGLGFQALAFGAFVLFVLTNVKPIGIAVAIAGALVLIASRALRGWTDPEARAQAFALGATALMLVVGIVAGPWRPYILVTTLFVIPLALAVAYFVKRRDLGDRGVRLVATAILVMIVLLIGVLWIVPVARPAADVLYLHESAAEVMLDGRNPYTDAYAVDTNPFAPDGAEYTGYVYPPIPLLAYAGADILFGDSRWASVIAMVIVSILIVRPWRTMTRSQAGALIAVGLAIVVHPWLGTVIWFGSTEPIALPLLIGAALLWRRHPVWSAVLLGLALGTKQYYVLALPLLLVWGDTYRWKRLLIAGGVAALAVLPAFLLDPAAAWDSMVVRLLDIAPRPDGIGITGLGLVSPFWVVLLVCTVVAVWMGLRGGSSARFVIALAATLSAAFLLGAQAFGNYWFLVAMLSLIAVAVDVSSNGSEADPDLVADREHRPVSQGS